MNFPDDCKTISDRMEFLYNAENKLRLIHNVFAKWYREGISLDVYNQLPNILKSKYSYQSKLSQQNWRDFFDNVFSPRFEKICELIGNTKAELRLSNRWQINMEDIDVG